MFSKNLVHLRKSKGWTQAVLAKKLAVARTTLGDYERGKTEPNLEMLSQMADLFSVPLDDLITGSLDREKQKYDKNTSEYPTYEEMDMGILQSVNLVETKAEAGYLESFQDPEYIRELPKLYIPHLPKNEYRGFEIEGDSMLPMESGTIVIGTRIDSLEDLRDQRTYIIITRRDGMVYKRIRTDANHSSLIAISDNPIFPAYTIPYENISEIWQYYAHLGFSDRPAKLDRSLDERVDDIQNKVNEMYRHLDLQKNKKKTT